MEQRAWKTQHSDQKSVKPRLSVDIGPCIRIRPLRCCMEDRGKPTESVLCCSRNSKAWKLSEETTTPFVAASRLSIEEISLAVKSRGKCLVSITRSENSLARTALWGDRYMRDLQYQPEFRPRRKALSSRPVGLCWRQCRGGVRPGSGRA